MFRAYPRRSSAGLVVLLACLAAALVPSPANAAGGLYTQILCANPASGASVIPDGQLPDGMNNPSHYSFMSGAACSAEGMRIGQHITTTSAHSGAALTYRAGDVAFKSAVLYRSWAGSESWGLFANRGAWDYMWTAPWDERCSSNPNYGCSSRGTSAARFVASNRTVLTAGTEVTNGFNLAVLCDASPGGTCRANPALGLRLYGGTVTLEDTSDPAVSGTPSGDLYTDVVGGNALRGARELSIAGTDTGAGLYRIRILLDDELRLSQVVNDNGGRCADVVPGDSDPYQFVHRRPCRASAGGDYEFDTTELAEGEHNLKLQLEDAAGNTSTVLNRTVTVDNIPAPSVVTAPQVSGVPRSGSSLAVTPAVFDDHGAVSELVVSRVWQRCKADGSACADIGGADRVSYTVADADLNRTLRVVETARNGEGSTSVVSALTGRATRADGTLPSDNDGVDNDGDGEVDEPGETTPAPIDPDTPGPSQPDPGSSGVAPTINGTNGLSGADGRNGSNGVSSGASSSASVNGEGASPDARLSVAFARGGDKGKVAYGKTIVARGRLVDGSGRPIRNAIVDIAETQALHGAKAASGRPAVTEADGSFSYAATSNAGTRSLTFQYRYQRQGAVVAQQTLALTVKAGVRLAVKLKGVTATYTGRVLAGSMPRGGKLVIVQGRAKGGSWQTFASRRANRAGKFKGKYRLKVRRPGKQLQFRVRVLSESGWNYAAATSKAVTRRVR
jgi:hypothetical protein